MTVGNYGWELLGGDPAPGEVGSIRSLARRFTRTADDAGDVVGRLARVQSGDLERIWVGPAADAFREKLGELPKQLGKLRASYSAAGDALSTYANALEDLQGRAERIRSAAIDAVDRLDDTQRAKDQELATNPQALTTHHDSAMDAARRALSKAKDDVEDVRRDKGEAERQAAHRLDEAGEKGIQNERFGWLKRALRVIGEVAEWIGVAVAIVSLVVPGVNLVTLAIVGAVAAAVVVATKLGRKSLGDDISMGEIGVDAALAVGNLVGLGAAVKGARVAQAARAARAAGALDDGSYVARGVRTTTRVLAADATGVAAAEVRAAARSLARVGEANGLRSLRALEWGETVVRSSPSRTLVAQRTVQLVERTFSVAGEIPRVSNLVRAAGAVGTAGDLAGIGLFTYQRRDLLPPLVQPEPRLVQPPRVVHTFKRFTTPVPAAVAA